MMEDGSEFSAVPIRDDQLVAWPRVAAVAAMVGFSLPTFLTGLEIFSGLSPVNALWALFWGSMIVVTVGAIMGYIGASARMSSYLLVRVAFGDKGAALVNIAFAVSLMGWFGLNINLFMDTVGRLASELWGLEIAPVVLAILASTCMTLTTLVGFKAINWLSSLLVPVLIVVTVLFARSAFSNKSWGDLMAMDVPARAVGDNAMSIGDGISLIVGAVIIGAIILPDITRFIRNKSGAIYTAILCYLVVQMLVTGAAGMAGASSGVFESYFDAEGVTRTDVILKLMLDVNLGIGAFIIIIAGSWVLNSLNLYSTVLSTKATFPKLNTKWLTIALGAVGVIAALMNILGAFATFLWYLSIIFIPVAGVLVIDRLLLRPEAYNLETLADNNTLNTTAFASWAIGAAFAILADRGMVPTATGIGAMDALLLSAVLYIILSKALPRKTS
ncbi:MAG: cytosine permease [Hellea sp.]|nr:cytosine permease [Hellea sp.]